MASPILRYFDNAATTRCSEEAAHALARFATETYGNPASNHCLGQDAARAVREARRFFADIYQVEPDHVVFTGSGTEADNLAVYGIAFEQFARKKTARVLVSATEHPAVKKCALSLAELGIGVDLIPVDSAGQIDRSAYAKLLSHATTLVSIHQVNNIVGTIHPVEELAEIAKASAPHAIFHSDAVQAFGKIKVPKRPVDLVSISAHKIEGPKGVGALILLNPSLMRAGLRPLIWGGGQESGLRSGTQNAGAIVAFHLAAKKKLATMAENHRRFEALRDRLRAGIAEKNLNAITWNSPLRDCAPHIVNLSVPGYPSGPLAMLLEERGCLVSTGSACAAKKAEPEPVLAAMGLSESVQTSTIRVSFGATTEPSDVDALIIALAESITLMDQLMGQRMGSSSRKAR